ncbi:hypothetical protein HCA33_01650 [Listeria seeligeri]|uniref:hypothetical protein n=1 Tax=Listeria seeligeri TaxID=1640 RepID=UPI0016261FBA|nr:hypothetical protein [Listeria seeligeri]MBC1442614.1 hypothetical protein [Listeria seeligeri]MBC1542096.1 hypothetical protein [Listeria seeligeri]MBC1582652.1 hypothetical protein [Listeria seeligeri]MBC1772656.1 hypothetical protein [Listeria seeligeri]MBC1866882.1 hypothetical protein [Listeria seeligeri]
MKKEKDFLSSISFEEANNSLKMKDIYQVMKNDKKQNFSIEMKKIIILILGLAFPISMVFSFALALTKKSLIISNSIVIVAELLIIIVMCYQFFRAYPPFLKNYGYVTYCYSIAKLAYISYFAVGLGMTRGSYSINFFVFLIAILVFLYLYHKVEKNMILEEINKTFNQDYKISKVLTIMLRFSGLSVVIALVIMQFYRLNKSWIINLRGVSGEISSNITDDVIGIVFGIPLLLLITLIPTFFLFKPNLFVRGKVIKNYSEEFRKVINFTEKEWYGKK